MSRIDQRQSRIAELADRLTSASAWVTTVESCTGGGIAFALTGIAGSSNWFERGLVTYGNQAKSELAGVPIELIIANGAVSEAVAAAMAAGGRYRAGADYCMSVTGIAGPGGGSTGKPVGMVCFGWIGPRHAAQTGMTIFEGDRQSVREQSIDFALSGLLDHWPNL